MKMYVVHQSLKDTQTISVYGTYVDRKAAERAIDQAKSPQQAFANQTRDARYFIEEREVEEIGAPAEQQQGQQGQPQNPEGAQADGQLVGGRGTEGQQNQPPEQLNAWPEEPKEESAHSKKQHRRNW